VLAFLSAGTGPEILSIPEFESESERR